MPRDCCPAIPAKHFVHLPPDQQIQKGRDGKLYKPSIGAKRTQWVEYKPDKQQQPVQKQASPQPTPPPSTNLFSQPQHTNLFTSPPPTNLFSLPQPTNLFTSPPPPTTNLFSQSQPTNSF